MVCPKCKSENMQVQMINKQHFKQGHGCLYSLFFGIFYWGWLAIKWASKYFKLFLYFFLIWPVLLILRFIISLIKRRPFSIQNNMKHPEWVLKMMRKKGRVYNTQTKMAVCQNCGYSSKRI